MVKVILHGCNGRMGQMLSSLIAADEEMEVVAGIEPSGEVKNGYPVYKSFIEFTEKADVIIDFSTAAAMDSLLTYCEKTHTPLVEKHHNQKLDAPSGTALALADVMKDELDDISYNLNRTEIRKKRDKNEIGISSVRGGTIVGEHEVIFAGTDEVIEIKHTAYSRAIFAKGAMSAAKFLKGKNVGKYDMSDVIG